ncbi:hypothetical protein [Rufibacter immobilis]|uniref:hypothetical protein n=1 Tax=Rufibacter immobilis TaxID=1348778 RepID=UPI0035F0C942
MEKKLFAVIVLVLTVGPAFAQAPADSTQTVEAPKERPHLRYKVKPDRWANRLGKSRRGDVVESAPADVVQPQDVTTIYSNMPVAKVGGGKRGMPSAPIDSTKHYHLRKKRYQVLPIPGHKEEAAEQEAKR